MFDKYRSLIEKLEKKDQLILFSLLGDVMERFRNTKDENLEEEFNKRAKPLLISTGMWESEENENEDRIQLEEYATNSINNSYSRIKHFADCIRKYQGKNKINIKKEELEKLKMHILCHWRKEEITRKHILDFVETFAVKSAKGNENALFFYITGKYVDDISHLENQLLEDFRVFSAEYDLIVKDGERKKFLYNQFVMFHLLKRLGHDVKEENFSMIKMEERKKKHEEICSKIFKRLRW